MPDSVESRLATIEQVLRDMRDDIQEGTAERLRIRGRLHDLEATAQGLIHFVREQKRQDENQWRRIELRLQWMTFVVGALGLVLAIGVFVTGK